VHKRFAPALAAHIVAATPGPTFERFTDRARRVIADARLAATDSGDDSVRPEHMLLALFSEPAGLAARALAAMGVSKETVVAAIRVRGETTAGDAEAGDGTADDGDGRSGPAFSGPAKRVLRDALTVALEFGHDYIGTEHLLLGLYRNTDGAASAILLQAGAPEATARAHVTDMLRGFKPGN
jgi:ATP-dependent Clp protease ATP-binding subunit ClpA